MADDKINKENVTQAKEYLRTLIEAKDISRDITDFTKELFKNYKNSSEQAFAILSTYKDISKSINNQANNILQVLDNEKSTKDIAKDILKNKNLLNRLDSESISLSNEKKALNLEAARLTKQLNKAVKDNDNEKYAFIKKEEKALQDKLDLNQKILGTIKAQGAELKTTNDINEKALELSSNADKKTKGFSTIEKIVKSIPGLKGLSEPFEKASKAARAAALSQKSGFEIFKAGAGGMTSFLKGPIWLTALLAVSKFFYDAMIGADKRVTDIAKNLSVSKDVSRAIYRSFIDSKSVLTAQLSTTKNIVEAFNELSDLSNFVNLANTKQLDTQIILTKEIGVSKEAAIGFQSTLAVSNIEADKGLNIVYDQIAAFANQNKIVANGRKTFEEINKTSKLTQLNFRGGFESLVKTTLQANKLGLSLDQVSKVGSSLLNFESSISAELEAELLTGKNINLEKARLFALNHDIAGLTQEIANQGITAEKFTAMNVIQQEAIAKALGMQASELGEALYNQKLIEQTAGNVTKDLRARAVEEGKLGHLQEERLLMQRAEGIEKGLIQGKDIEAAQRSLDIQTQFDNALEQAKEVFSDFVDGKALSDFAKFLTSFVKSVQTKGLLLTLTTGISDSAKLEAQAMFSNEGEDKPYGDSSQPPIIQTPTIVTTQPLVSPNVPISSNTNNINAISDPLDARAAETNKLLRELNENIKKGGNVYIDSKMAGTATAQGTYKL
jgi:hypothetical protein